MIRLVCSWATDEATVDRLIDEVRGALAASTGTATPPGGARGTGGTAEMGFGR